MPLLSNARQVYAEEGGVSLFREGLGLISKKTSNKFLHSIFEGLYGILLPEYMSFEIGGYGGEFNTSVLAPNTGLRHDIYSESKVLSSFLEDLKPDDIFYDIGSNVGIYSVFASEVIEEGKIVAFEPHPVAVTALYKNLDRNCRKFDVFQLALSNNDGFGKMEIDFSTDANIRSSSGINVPLTKAERIVQTSHIEAPTAAKVDVEGAELDVLKGFGDYLSQLELIYVEVHHTRGDKFGSSLDEVVDLLDVHFEVITEINRRGEEGQTHIKASSR